MSEGVDEDRTQVLDAAPRRPGLIDASLLAQLRDQVVSVTAPWWQGEVISANGLIYGVNIAGSRPPLFWCFQGYEEFSAFGRALGGDQPLYGMRSGHLVVASSNENYMHMAVNCAAEIHDLGLDGPVFIGGNCQGSLLAQKVAQILIASGRAVALLISLNPFLFSPYAGRAAFIVGRYDVTNPFDRFHDADMLLRANVPHSTVDVLPSEHGKVFSDRILALLSDTVRRRMNEASVMNPGAHPIWSLRAELTVAPDLKMVPASVCEVPVTLRNSSDVVWGASSQSGIAIGNHWRHSDGRTLQWLDGQALLDRSLAPGEARDLVLLVRTPAEQGEYLLEIDVQHAGLMWLSEIGLLPAVCKVRISPPAV